ncbi:MAG: DUF3800 domain-containing protein [Elusimicrobia bacterium]|nr:DUF3800 domain-containing protein [Candidatus Liberimonas magnetica]
MLFFIDESWQTTEDNKYKVGVLSAIQINSHDYNMCSQYIHDLKIKNLGFKAGDIEIKGSHMFREFVFRLEEKQIVSRELTLARDIFAYMKTAGVLVFASVVFAKEEADLACADVRNLERPFFFLFERINIFMKENYPNLMAKIIFDDRNISFNQKLSKSVSNFFHRSHVGQTFDNIIKVPFFAISTENVGIQFADMVAYILGSRFTGDRGRSEFFKFVKSMEFKSRTKFNVEGKEYPCSGIKVIKEKEAGDLFISGRDL